MRFSLPAFLVSLAAAAVSPAIAAPMARQQCAEAARFGTVEVVPSTLSVGDSFTVHADFTCSLYFDIVPEYIDYYIEVTSGGNGHFGPVLLARREFHQSLNTPPTDTFTADLPDAFYTNGTTYAVTLDTTYPVNGTNNTPYYTVGGTESSPLTINGISSA